MSNTFQNNKLHSRLAKLATFWIPIKKVRRKLRGKLSHNHSTKIIHEVQNLLLFESLTETKNLVAFLLPHHHTISGGIFSIFSIAKQSKNLKHIHQSETVVMTRPNDENHSYFRQTYFKNDEIVYRFEQITQFKNLTNLILHIPEFACSTFYDLLTPEQIQFLKKIDQLSINIMNQNIQLMPDKNEFSALYDLTPNITQTVAHHKYSSQKFCDEYSIPSLLLPAYTDLTPYAKKDFGEKENIIMYSPDSHKKKNIILSILKQQLPNYIFIEVKNLSFDAYMDLATRARFSITFGEGYDGYLAQPIYQGGISFAVYNDDFFPHTDYKNFFNIFNDYDELQNELVERIHQLEKNPDQYTELSKNFVSEMEKLYNFDNYLECIQRFYLANFDYYPSKPVH